MKIIGLTGYKGSGKDTTFEAIVAQLPSKTVYRVAFGDNVKELAARAFGFCGDNLWVDEDKGDPVDWMNHYKNILDVVLINKDIMDEETSFSIRYYIQQLGHTGREMFGENFWVDQTLPTDKSAFEKLYPYALRPDVLVVTDVRYDNEAERVLGHGGTIWKINRPGAEGEDHPSETAIDSKLVKYEIDNNGDITTLESQVNVALLELL